MNVIASEPIRGGNDDPIKGRLSHLFSKSVESWTTQLCSAVAIIAKDVFLLPRPSLGLMIFLQAVELLFDRLCLCLSLCRNADVDRDVHGVSPVVSTPGWREAMMVRSIEEAVDRFDPTDAARQEPQS